MALSESDVLLFRCDFLAFFIVFIRRFITCFTVPSSSLHAYFEVWFLFCAC